MTSRPMISSGVIWLTLSTPPIAVWIPDSASWPSWSISSPVFSPFGPTSNRKMAVFSISS